MPDAVIPGYTRPSLIGLRIHSVYNLRIVAAVVCMATLASCNSGNTNRGTPVSQEQQPVQSSPIDGPIRYVAVGDSTGVGVGARDGGYVIRLFRFINSVKPDSKLTNLCFSGATTSDVIRDQLDSALKANPNLVTLAIGINDIGHGVSKDQFGRNYELILSMLRARTNARIVVANIPDISSAPRIPEFMRAEYQQQIVEFNGIVEGTAARHRVTVFDVFTLTQRELREHPEYFSHDGFHPSDLGYQLWAEQMWPVVARTIGTNQ